MSSQKKRFQTAQKRVVTIDKFIAKVTSQYPTSNQDRYDTIIEKKHALPLSPLPHENTSPSSEKNKINGYKMN